MSEEYYRVHALRKQLKEALEREEQLKIDLEDRSVLADMYIKACVDMTVENVKLKEQIEHQRDLKCKALVLCGEAINQNVTLKKELFETQHELANWINDFKAWPGAWCCQRARGTNGWHHSHDCKNQDICY